MAGYGACPPDALQQVTGGMLELNHDAIKLILQMKQVEFKSKSFSSLMRAYMEASLRNLDLCCAMEHCIRRARNAQSIVQHRLQEAVDDGGQDKTLIMRTKEELTKLRTELDPFPQDLYALFDLTRRGVESLVGESEKQAQGVDTTLKRIKTWTKLSIVLFAVGYFSVLILSGVTLAVNVPSPVEVLAGALLATLGSIGKWINYYSKQEEKRIGGLQDCLDPVKMGARVMLSDMESIRIIVDRWKDGIERLVHKCDTVLREEEEIVEMMIEWDTLKGITEEMSEHVTKFSMDTRQARVIPLQKIIQIDSSDEEKMNCLEIIM